LKQILDLALISIGVKMTLGLDRLIRFWDHHIGYSKSDPVKSFVKSIAGRTNTSLVQRVLAYSIMRSQFDNLHGVEVLAERERQSGKERSKSLKRHLLLMLNLASLEVNQLHIFPRVTLTKTQFSWG
jgi:hypothetical protein